MAAMDLTQKKFLQRRPTEKSYYDTLEIDTDTSDAEIKNAYRRQILMHYSQRFSRADAYMKFSEASEAYDALSNSHRRAIYDKFGKEGLKRGIPLKNGGWSSGYAYHGDLEKTLMEVFATDDLSTESETAGGSKTSAGFGGPSGQMYKKQDPPIELDLFVSLEDLFHGCVKKIKISRQVLNEDGRSYSVKDFIFSVEVKPGLKDGMRIVYPKQGDQKPNNIPADIIFIVRQKPHRLFHCENNDLIYTADITLEKALIGFSVNLETLDGKLLSIPVNDVVHPKYSKLVPGEGMPIFLNPSTKGNLILKFNILYPTQLSAEQKHFIKSGLSKCCQHPLKLPPQHGNQAHPKKIFKERAERHDVMSIDSDAAVSGETRTGLDGHFGQLDKKQDPPVESDIYLSLKDFFNGCTKAVNISRRELNEDGRTTRVKNKILVFKVKPGLEDGARITFAKEGNQGPNNIPSDIIFIVHQKPHPLFRRENNDLIYTTDISLEKVLTGFTVDVETLDGKLLSIPINDIVHTKVVPGEGMPLLNNPSTKGNLIIHFNILFPEQLSAKEKHFIKSAFSK